ncbi:MAG: hypothetical protein KKH28_11315 [Elusimicrobia bacterium]|nr:hypothetical protein [Elusimicrobiota bacterium]
MQWTLKECRDGFLARKTTGLTAYIRRACLWAEFKVSRGPGYDVNYKGFTIARIYFENKGATVKALELGSAFPEISDLDLVEIALRVSKLREATAAALN